MPSISAVVAQVNAVVRLAACCTASAVHLCAFTWGRSLVPGSARAIVSRFDSIPAESTRRAGAVSCEVLTAGRLPTGGAR